MQVRRVSNEVPRSTSAQNTDCICDHLIMQSAGLQLESAPSRLIYCFYACVCRNSNCSPNIKKTNVIGFTCNRIIICKFLATHWDTKFFQVWFILWYVLDTGKYKNHVLWFFFQKPPVEYFSTKLITCCNLPILYGFF